MNDEMKKPLETNFSTAWNEFKKTTDYKRLCDVLAAKFIKQPYIDNIIQNAFAAGFRMSGVQIKIIKVVTKK